MALSPEDALGLNVLLANRPQAIRIDASPMMLHALAERGESGIRLNPNCRDDLYRRRVWELFSGQMLGSPEGYPVFLRRWSRMGQARDDNLERLLLLGEPDISPANPHPNSEPGTIVAFPDETFGLVASLNISRSKRQDPDTAISFRFPVGLRCANLPMANPPLMRHPVWVGWVSEA